MFKYLLNFQGINWWVLLGGLGLNFILNLVTSLFATYLAVYPSTAEIFKAYGAPFMVILLFVVFVGAGFVVGKIADDEPVKHAFWASLGAAVPFLVGAVLFVNPNQLMLAAVAVAGALNGGMLAIRKPRYTPPSQKR
jgi:hypothetical protein